MAKVNVSKVEILNNPCAFLDNFKCEITFEVFENLEEDLEWKLTYVGSSESNDHDQVLDSVLVGPVPEGRHKFILDTPPPNPDLIPVRELVDVTVFLLSCAYKGKEFVTVGYFVSIQYIDEELRENPPEKPVFEKLQRLVDVSEPRVTRFKIPWDDDVIANAATENKDPKDNENDSKQDTVTEVVSEVDSNPTPAKKAKIDADAQSTNIK